MLAACQKLFDHDKQSAADTLKTTLKRVNQKNSRNNWWFDG